MRRRLVAVVAGALLAWALSSCGLPLVAPPARAVHRVHLHSAAWCAYHVWRGAHDALSHHGAWAAWHAWRAVHHCGRLL